MKTITSLTFDPPQAGTIYALSGAFTETIPVVVSSLSQELQAIIANALQLLKQELPEGTTSIARIVLERYTEEEKVSFGIEAVALNAAGGVAVVNVSASDETTTALDILWLALQDLINS